MRLGYKRVGVQNRRLGLESGSSVSDRAAVHIAIITLSF